MSDPMAWLHQAATEAPAPAPVRRIPKRTEPSPAGHVMAWADDGACTDLDPDMFFPGRGEDLPAEAAAACRTCPVQADCLDWALHHEHHGYWGGQCASAEIVKGRHLTAAEHRRVVATIQALAS